MLEAPQRLVQRLVNYVVKGDEENVLADLATLKNTHLAVPLISTRYRHLERKGLP